MAIDFQALINNKLPSLVRRESLPVGNGGFGRSDRFNQILKNLMPPQEEAPDPSSQQVASETSELENANPDEESGFNIFNSLFSVLDAFGRPVRGVIGAGTAALKGDFDKAGSRLLDAALSPIDSLTFNIFDVAKEKNNTTGSHILDDLGWKAGTTTEDERRIRIAMAAGLSHRDALRQFGMFGDKALSAEAAQSFETVIQQAKKRNPEIDLNPNMQDFKNAVDGQDFGGFAVDVLTDPLTYLSMGATAVGKAAKAVGMLAEQAPKLMRAVRAATSKADAIRVITESAEIGSKQQRRLSKMVGRAWDQSKEGAPSLHLADNWGKQVREGQRAALVTLGGRPLIKGGPVAEVLSHIGQTKSAEEILGKATVSGTLGKAIELPLVNKVVGGVKGLVRLARDKMDTKTGVGFIDDLMIKRDAEARTHLTELGRVMNEMDAEIKEAAGVAKSVPKAVTSDGEEIIKDVFHGTNKEFSELSIDAPRVMIKDKEGRGKVRGLFFTPDEKIAANYVAATFNDTVAKLGKDVPRWHYQTLSEGLDTARKAGQTLDQWAMETAKSIKKQIQGHEAQGWFRGKLAEWMGKTTSAVLHARNAQEGWHVLELSLKDPKELASILTQFASKDPGFKQSWLGIVPVVPGIRPRILKQTIKGKTLDLTDARKWPAGLVKALETGTGADDARVYKRYLDAVQSDGKFKPLSTVERSESLNKWLDDNLIDIVKKPENDKLTGDFSYWVRNQKALHKDAPAQAPWVDAATQATRKVVEQQLRKQTALAAELMKQHGGSAEAAVESARIALGMPRALSPEVSAKVAAGITAIYEDVAQRAVPQSGVVLFRGVTPGRADTAATFHSADRKVAENYAGKTGQVTEGKAVFNKLLEADTWVAAKSKIGLNAHHGMQELQKAAKEKGFDGISFNTLNGKEYIVLDQKVFSRESFVGTRLRELNDESISYIHRMLTPEAKKFFKEQGAKASKWTNDSGLEFNARSRTFNARSEDSYGKTFVELNDDFKAKHNIDLFVADPIQPARVAVRSAQRAIANAKFGEAFVREYGQATSRDLNTLLDSIGEMPELLLNMRKAAELKAATGQAAARVAREEGKTHIGEVARRLEKMKAPKAPDLSKIPETPDTYGIANYFKKVLKDNDLSPAGEVSAFDIYNRLGIKLPDNPEDIAKLVSVTVPEEAAAFVTRALKLQAEPHRLIQYYDKVTNWMKSWVTVPFLAFHGRNFLENSFKNLVEGNANPRNYKNAGKLLSQASDLNAGAPDWIGKAGTNLKRMFKGMGEPDKRALRDMKEAGVGETYPQIADWLVAHNILDNRITSEFGEVVQDGVMGQSAAARTVRGLGAKAVKELGTQGGAIRAGYALGAGTENLHRVSLFLDRLDKGYSAIEAAAEVKRVFFDYRNLTHFESTYMKRAGFFYSFYRNNLRYILGKLAEQPQFTKQTLGMFQNDPDNPKQKWLSDKGAFTAGAKEVALGFLPQQQFKMFGFDGEDVVDKLTNKAQQTLGMGNPLLTTPMEVAFNKDLFTGGQLMQESTTLDWSFAPEAVQDAIGYRQTPEGEHKIGRFWRLLTSAVPVVGRFSSNAIMLSSKERSYWEKLTQISSGVRVADRDLEKEDLALIDRNLMRAKSDLPLVRKDGYNNYRVNGDTAQGRVASALLFPSKAKMKDLALQPEVLFTLKPYMTFDKDGEVVVTDYLKTKMHEVAVNYFPKEQAFFDGVETRKAVVRSIQARKPNKFDAQAAEDFNAFLTGAR